MSEENQPSWSGTLSFPTTYGGSLTGSAVYNLPVSVTSSCEDTITATVQYPDGMSETNGIEIDYDNKPSGIVSYQI